MPKGAQAGGALEKCQFSLKMSFQADAQGDQIQGQVRKCHKESYPP
jgi:hypothetical protein